MSYYLHFPNNLTDIKDINIGNGVHTSSFLDQCLPFSKLSLFLKIQDVSIFHRPIGKTKVLNLLTDLHIISTLKVS